MNRWYLGINSLEAVEKLHLGARILELCSEMTAFLQIGDRRGTGLRSTAFRQANQFRRQHRRPCPGRGADCRQHRESGSSRPVETPPVAGLNRVRPALQLEQCIDREETILTNIKMGPNSEQALGDGEVAVAQRTLDHGVRSGLSSPCPLARCPIDWVGEVLARVLHPCGSERPRRED
jgi:hypothetical protein